MSGTLEGDTNVGVFSLRYVLLLASCVLCCHYHDPPLSTYKLIPTNYVSPITGLVEFY